MPVSNTSCTLHKMMSMMPPPPLPLYAGSLQYQATMSPNPSSSPSSSPSEGAAAEPNISLATTLSDSKQSFTAKYEAARLYIDSLAKPVGSLGTLEDWGARMAALQQTTTPNADSAACLIFAADHGVAKDTSEGGRKCSAYPQIVSRKVLEALDHGIVEYI